MRLKLLGKASIKKVYFEQSIPGWDFPKAWVEFSTTLGGVFCLLPVPLPHYQGNTSPERENALSVGYVPILSKFAPSSCYNQQKLGKKCPYSKRCSSNNRYQFKIGIMSSVTMLKHNIIYKRCFSDI